MSTLGTVPRGRDLRLRGDAASRGRGRAEAPPPILPVLTATDSPALVSSVLGATASAKERCRTVAVGAQQRFGSGHRFACWEA